MSENKVILRGNLGKEVVLRKTASGKSVANFSIATNEVFKGENGNTNKHTEWHSIVAWGRTAENCAQYLKKGSHVLIEGKIRTNSWKDKNNLERQTKEIHTVSVRFLDSRGTNESAETEEVVDNIPDLREETKRVLSQFS